MQVPAFGDWGFQLASKKEISLDDISLQVDTRFLEKEQLKSMFSFAKDEKVDKDKIYANTLARPQLISYYMEAERNWR